MVTRSKLQKKAKSYLGQYVENVLDYRRIVEVFQYLILTITEIAFIVHKLSQYVSTPILQHVMACNSSHISK